MLPGLVGPDAPSASRQEELRRLARLSRLVTTPALMLVWVFGIAMAVDSGWYASGWLKAKVVLVLMLSGWHGGQSRILRRLAAGRTAMAPRHRSSALAALAVAAIIVLVVVKPF